MSVKLFVAVVLLLSFTVTDTLCNISDVPLRLRLINSSDYAMIALSNTEEANYGYKTMC